MSHHSDVLNPEGVGRPKRVRRPRVLQVVIGSGHTSPPRGRRNPHGWRFANEARRRQAYKKAGQMFVLHLGGHCVSAIAAMFGTTTTAVYQQLYRLRSGFYDKPLARKGPPPRLSIEYVYQVARAPEPEW